MTVGTTSPVEDAQAVSSAVLDYAFSFDADEVAHVKAEIQETGETPITLVYDTDYTAVFTAGDTTGGTVTLTSGAATTHDGKNIVVYRATPIEQDTDLPNQGPYFSRTVEGMADYLTYILQERNSDLDRAFRAPLGSTGGSVEVGDENTVPAWDALGNLKKTDTTVTAIAQAAIDAARAEAALAATLAGIANNGFYMTPEMFQATGDGDFAAGTGTDDSAAFTQLIAAAALNKVPILLTKAYYIADADVLRVASAVRFSGESFAAGLIVECDATQNGYQILGPSVLHGFRIHVKTTEAKPGDSGHLQNCIGVGNGYIEDTDHAEVSGWHVQNMRLTRASGVGSGYAFGGFGNVTNGYVGEITDFGSGEDHSGVIQFHWGGVSATGTIGEEITKSWHPRNIRIGAVECQNTVEGITISSSSSISQEGLVHLDGARRILYLLPGDETDSVSQHDAGIVGKGIVLKGPFVGVNMQNESTAEGVHIFSAGTSRWADMPNDAGVALGDQLEMDVTLGDITFINSPNADKKLFYVIGFHGRLRVGKIAAYNCASTERALDITSSYGAIDIEEIDGDFYDDALYFTRCSNVRIGGGRVSCSQMSSSSHRVMYSFGDQTNMTASGAHSAGATSLTLTAGVARRVLKGQRLLADGEEILATAYAPVGTTVLEVTALPSALTGGETIVHDNYCYNMDIGVSTVGGYYGFDMAGTFGAHRGAALRAGVAGGRVRNASVVDFIDMEFDGNGRNRQATPALGTSDLLVTNTATRVKMSGGSMGRDGRLTEYNLRLSTTESTWRRFIGVNVAFLGNVSGHVTASSTDNYSLVACTDKDGDLIT